MVKLRRKKTTIGKAASLAASIPGCSIFLWNDGVGCFVPITKKALRSLRIGSTACKDWDLEVWESETGSLHAYIESHIGASR